MTVYLAGGTHSGWQDDVIENGHDNVRYVSPADLDQKNMSLEEFGTWDLHFVKQADIVFVYLERTNPSCIGAAVEAGFAAGQGTTVILVQEPDSIYFADRYLDFVQKVADVTFDNFEDGLDYLHKITALS